MTGELDETPRADCERVYRYRLAAPGLATSGQPREDEIAAIAAAGYEVVINLALHDDPRYSLADEAGSVRALGVEYVHIPVKFDAPSRDDLRAFFDAMDAHRGRRLWVHCAANLRVSAFLALHRHFREGWTTAQAFGPMREVWEPNAVWARFLDESLAAGDPGRPS